MNLHDKIKQTMGRIERQVMNVIKANGGIIRGMYPATNHAIERLEAKKKIRYNKDIHAYVLA